MNGAGTMMTRADNEVAEGSVQAELSSFAARMLEQCGGLVEWNPNDAAGTAVLPSNVAKLFGVPETVALAPQQEQGTLCISLASEFLDQSQVVLETLVPRIGTFRIPDHYLKGGDLQEAVERQFTWHNARVRFRESGPVNVDYHNWTLFASIRSEDVWESRLSVTLNTASHSPVELPDLFGLPDLEPCHEPQLTDPDDTFPAAVKQVQAKLLHQAAPFFARTQSRLDRDRKRLRDYYGALQRESTSTKRRTTTAPSADEIESRQRAVNLELQRKLAELDERYQMEATLTPIALAIVRVNVLAIELLIQRKRAERTYHVYWNPLSKQFEPLCCSLCGQGTFSVTFTDNDVAALCARCDTT